MSPIFYDKAAHFRYVCEGVHHYWPLKSYLYLCNLSGPNLLSILFHKFNSCRVKASINLFNSTFHLLGSTFKGNWFLLMIGLVPHPEDISMDVLGDYRTMVLTFYADHQGRR